MLELSDEQQLVHQSVMAGKSCFLTGCGGTGKSFLTKHLITDLRRQLGRDAVAVTATTGIAACHIHGTSLHSFAGIGLGQAPDLVSYVRNNKHAAKIVERWKQTKCLVIDEISMLDGDLFDKLDHLARALRGTKGKPFGGIQLLLVGDFAQLPPVHGKFCFEGKSWAEAVELQVELTKVFRQADVEFVSMLRAIRDGVCTPETVAKLRECSRPLPDEGSGVRPTQLFCRNVDVDAINMSSVAKLPGEPITLLATDKGLSPHLEAMQKSCLAPATLVLKPGAQVMLLKNMAVKSGLSNGTRGVFLDFGPNGGLKVRFETKHGLQTVELLQEVFNTEVGGRTVAQRQQYPLRLAYAITVHKCQGMTLSKAELSLRDVFEYGQAYVALSRVSSMEGLQLVNFTPGAVRCHPLVLQFYKRAPEPEAKRLKAAVCA